MAFDSAVGVSSGIQVDGNRLVYSIRHNLDATKGQSGLCGFARDASRLHFDYRPQITQLPLFLNRQGHLLLTDCYTAAEPLYAVTVKPDSTGGIYYFANLYDIRKTKPIRQPTAEPDAPHHIRPKLFN